MTQKELDLEVANILEDFVCNLSENADIRGKMDYVTLINLKAKLRYAIASLRMERKNETDRR